MAATQPGSRVQRPKTDILLVTATEIEAKTVLTIFPKARRSFIGDKTYYDLGVMGDARIAMVQSEMGIGGQGGALLTVWEGIQALSPSTVIMVGIAFGLKPGLQQIGDILVSQQIRDYNPKKVSTDANNQPKIFLRGDLVSAPTLPLDRFRAGSKDWPETPQVHFGLILSGSDLINNLEYRNQLYQLEPEAIGGEMEGAGLYAAAQRRKVDWILVKAICDWGDGKKGDKYQQQAADNAVRFTLHVIQQGGFKREEPDITSPPLGTTLYSYQGHTYWVLALDWEPNGTRIVSAGADATAQVWNADTGQRLVTYRGHEYTGFRAKTKLTPSIYNVAWSPKAGHIASSGTGKNVYVWQVDNGGTLFIYKDHSGFFTYVFAIAWSPDGTRIASACSSTSTDNTIHIWDIRTGKTLLRCNPHLGLTLDFSVLALAWSPDGTRIAATCGDKTIRIWNAATGQRLLTYAVRTGMVNDLAWSPDSKFLATANPDATAQIWDITTGKLLLTYSGHSDSVRSVAWSPDGTSIASASNDKTVQIWDSATGNHIFTYHGHTNLTTSVAWSPDGTRIASASNDKTVQIWQAR
jgi:nucleoside phosphorylase/DNA-binding beta-propeller fold protein YncE